MNISGNPEAKSYKTTSDKPSACGLVKNNVVGTYMTQKFEYKIPCTKPITKKTLKPSQIIFYCKSSEHMDGVLLYDPRPTAYHLLSQ
jgi:hypothetical protein